MLSNVLRIADEDAASGETKTLPNCKYSSVQNVVRALCESKLAATLCAIVFTLCAIYMYMYMTVPATSATAERSLNNATDKDLPQEDDVAETSKRMYADSQRQNR